MKFINCSYDGVSSVKLSWKVTGDITRYIVYGRENNDTNYKKLTIVEGNSYRINNLEEGNYYAFTVREYNEVTQDEMYVSKNKINIATDVLTKPKKVTGLIVSDIGSASVRLSWSREYNISEYTIYRYVNGHYEAMKKVQSNSIKLENLNGNKMIAFAIGFPGLKDTGKTKKYILMFTAFNFGFLAVLTGFQYIVKFN